MDARGDVMCLNAHGNVPACFLHPFLQSEKKETMGKKRPSSDDSESDFSDSLHDESEQDGDYSNSSLPVSKAPIKKSLETARSTQPQGRAVEDIYQKKTQLEHILLRPDTYIGSIESQDMNMWVLAPLVTPKLESLESSRNTTPTGTPEPTRKRKSIANSPSFRMIFTQISFVPGFYKIFDEILVNAADNKVRDPTMTTIKVNIDSNSNTISVFNDGRGIPVEMHKKEQVYVPELIFGHLLTSSNYDDKEKKVTGGRNGYGAKLCNIFSKEFIVETCDAQGTGLKFKQTFKNNMSWASKPSISPVKEGTKDYTKITYKPDLEKFGMEKMDEALVGLLMKRVYDVAGVVRHVKVYLNNKLIKFKSFADYVKFYLSCNDNEDEFQKRKIIASEKTDRWEVIVVPSDGQFQQVSFVNSICTLKGGTHVSYISDQIVSRLQENVKKQLKDVKNASNVIKAHTIKSQLWIFINCMIENPSFDSQTKENMTTKPSKFGSSCSLSDDFMKKVLKSDIIDNIMRLVKAKEEKQLKKTDGSKRSRISGISKLDDANLAGTKHGKDCTLILTEGDSAKALAVSGLSVIGRDKFGVFPLRGKLLNVREAKTSQVLNNEEINCIKRILGLQHQKEYRDTDSLRYGHVMIMADQDHDGSHIKGLLLNLFDYFWPSLLKLPGFMLQFITPIVKVTRGTREICFYTLPEYEQWKQSNQDGRGWNIKYYKGLGTSTSADAKKYFSNISRHARPFEPSKEDDRALLDLVFSKKRADERKRWLEQYEAGTFLDNQASRIRITEFINKELILHSMADNVRSIPSVVDGLKPGHRKILFACVKRNLVKGELKVAQLAGYVSEHSAYHHGENSLAQTIILMAHDFVGSNNIHLLEPIGQFGTRLQGGKDHAAPRYIFTRLTALSRKIFHPFDDKLLNYRNDDGMSIEPDWYIPILPMVLINGAEGIGTGWSTTVLNYNPLDIANNLLKKLRDGQDFEPIHPWYRGFNGKIERIADDKYSLHGMYSKLDANTIEITELPVGVWTQTYKEFLEELLVGSDKTEPFIKDYKEYHTETRVHFVVQLLPGNLAKLEQEAQVEKKFKLVTTKTSNLVLFDHQQNLKKYANILEILNEFYTVRLDFYSKRKLWLESKLQLELEKLENKVGFLLAVVRGDLVIQNRKRVVIVSELRKMGFKEFSKEGKELEAVDEDEADGAGFDYLLSLSIWNLTFERIEKLEREKQDKMAELTILQSKKAEDLWVEDLDEFLQLWKDAESTLQEKMNAAASTKGKKAKGLQVKKPRLLHDTSDDDFAAASKKKGKTKNNNTIVKAETPSSGNIKKSSPFTLDDWLTKSEGAAMSLNDVIPGSAADLPAKTNTRVKPAMTGISQSSTKRNKPIYVELDSSEEESMDWNGTSTDEASQTSLRSHESKQDSQSDHSLAANRPRRKSAGKPPVVDEYVSSENDDVSDGASISRIHPVPRNEESIEEALNEEIFHLIDDTVESNSTSRISTSDTEKPKGSGQKILESEDWFECGGPALHSSKKRRIS